MADSLTFNDTLGLDTLSGTISPDYSNNSVLSGSLTLATLGVGALPAQTYTNLALTPNGTDASGQPMYVLSGTSTTGQTTLSIMYTGQLPTSSTATISQNGATVASGSGTVTSTACYVTGTLIRTVRGDVAVEDLAVGDLVVTASGAHRPIRWLGHRSYSARFARNNPDLLPICFKAGSLAQSIPARDLWVSPKHAMYLDEVLIPAEFLVNGTSIIKAERAEHVEYWHVELESHDVLVAEGAPSESFVDDDSRAMFHNAHTFHDMYPKAKQLAVVYCAPRIEHGYALEAVRRRLAGRAGLPVPAARVFGPLRGHLDCCDGTTVAGWAQDVAYPDAPVCLDVVVDGKVVILAYAEQFRPDLFEDGIGDGRHAFQLALPVPLQRQEPHTIEVRRSADGAAIAGTKVLAATRPLAA